MIYDLVPPLVKASNPIPLPTFLGNVSVDSQVGEGFPEGLQGNGAINASDLA